MRINNKYKTSLFININEISRFCCVNSKFTGFKNKFLMQKNQLVKYFLSTKIKPIRTFINLYSILITISQFSHFFYKSNFECKFNSNFFFLMFYLDSINSYC